MMCQSNVYHRGFSTSTGGAQEKEDVVYLLLSVCLSGEKLYHSAAEKLAGERSFFMVGAVLLLCACLDYFRRDHTLFVKGTDPAVSARCRQYSMYGGRSV